MHTTNTISDSGVIDHLMRPWGDETLSPCERTAYVIASLAIGLFTAFIFHIAYNMLIISAEAKIRPLSRFIIPLLQIFRYPRLHEFRPSLIKKGFLLHP